MKTTIDIPDELARRARAVAHEHRTTLRELVISGVTAELDRRTAAPPIDFHFPTVAGHGLVSDVDPSDVIIRSYGISTP
ncbi:hypothetical protein FH969_10065 [Miniimonas arenae]|uniref:DUF2191 domain-containing protein n=1 Tax=Miniimonas arenae TaxID=676201 RepID=A0A5C5B9U8_9MICO|nr:MULTISPECIES: hypothetical protein [Miniimonas]TNU73668.1 hypothetical protein FH969_10065 [Miniimonas arenae]